MVLRAISLLYHRAALAHPRHKGYDYSVDERPEVLQDLEGSGAEFSSGSGSDVSPKPSTKPGRRRLLLNILGVILVIALILSTALLSHKKPAKKTTTITINTQSLSAGTLQKLEAKAGPGTVTERLVIAPDTLFEKGVEVQGSTSLDHGLAITGTLNLTGNLTVSGSITGASLSVGSLTINNLQLNNDLNFAGHLNPDGTAPTAKTEVATSGGTVTDSGSDTAWTVTINVGSGHLVAGEMVVIDFHKAFATTPRVQLTPVNNYAADLNYFVTQSHGIKSNETT